MEELGEGAQEETLPLASGRSEGGDATRCYLLVFAGGSSSVFPITPNSEIVVGRGDAANLRLLDASVSRAHAKIVSTGSEIRLVDLGSHNGSRVNGERVAGTRVLASGDVLTLGQVTLVLHRDVRTPVRRPLLELPAFRLRLEEEIERSLRYQRPVTVLSFELGEGQLDRARLAQTVSAQLRVIDAAAWTGEAQIAVILPETVAESAGAPAGRILRALQPHAPRGRVGFATCSVDGCDVDALLGGARTAARSARPGAVAHASEAATTMQVGDHKIVVADPAMTRLFGLIERLAVSDLPVLVSGETGTGKEIAARAMHLWSGRKAKPLVAINCAALQESLVESELFGYERGAFSGADSSKAGLFETADGGTLFLDEVGELSATVQAKLLRVVETKRLSRLGSVAEREVDVRVVAATNRSLEEEVRTGRFRQDLYFRLSAATVFIPPLRDRAPDVPILARTFLAEACARLPRDPMAIAPAAMTVLATYPWPGNVRELKNLMDYVAATVREPQLEPWLLPDRVTRPAAAKRTNTPVPLATATPAAPMPAVAPPATPHGGASQPAEAGRPGFRNIYDEIRELEKARMAAALEAAGGVQVRAAELIGMPLRTFVTKLKQYNLTGPRPRGGRTDG